MSGVNISYEIASSGEKIKYYEDSCLSPNEAPSLANVIAGEIVNEILGNALDIATRASDTGIHWKEIKESRSHHRATMNSSDVNETDSKNAKQKINESHRENICSNVVGDIVEHIGIPTAPDISEIIDGLNNINVNQETGQDKQSAVSIDVEMKKLLAEMLSPPYEIVNYDNLPVKGGVGDQPSEITETVNSEPTAEPEVPRAIEKKSRVTDLVKNSPQIISEYLMMDELAKQNQEEWEESTEQILQVIELDHVKPGEEAFRVEKSIFPERIALPKDNDEDELIVMPSDDIMDIVDLSSNAFKEEERQLFATNENSTGAKGDDRKSDNFVLITSKPYEEASSGGEVIESITYSQKQLVGTNNNAIVEQEKPKKKKCNFGMRLWGFLKKGHKAQEQNSSTSTQKPL